MMNINFKFEINLKQEHLIMMNISKDFD